MFHACAARFDVMRNLIKFWVFRWVWSMVPVHVATHGNDVPTSMATLTPSRVLASTSAFARLVVALAE